MQGVLVRRKYALTPGQLFRVCWEREKVLVSRNLFLYGFRCGTFLLSWTSTAQRCDTLSAHFLSCTARLSGGHCRALLRSQTCDLPCCRFIVTMFMAFVTATLFLRTDLHPDSVTSGRPALTFLKSTAPDTHSFRLG